MSARRDYWRRLIFACAVCQGIAAGDEPQKRPPPRFTLGKETTYFVRPLDKDGYVDYVAALNEHFGRGVTPQNNANVLYWRATGPMSESAGVPLGLFKLLSIDPPPREGLYHVDLGTYLIKHAKIEAGDPRYATIFRAFQDHAQLRPWHEGLFPHVGSWLTFNAAPLAKVVEGTKLPASYAPLYHPKDPDTPSSLENTLMYGLSARRDFARALTARAMLHLGEGRPHAAWEDLQACHRLANHATRGPWLIESLVGVSIDGMASAGDVTFLKHVELSAAQAAACLEQLQALPPLPPIAEKITVGERVMFLDSIQSMARHGRPALDNLLSELGEESPPEWLATLDLSQIDWDEALKTGNLWFDRCAKALGVEDRPKMLKGMEELEGKVRELAMEVRAATRPSAPLASDAEARKTTSRRLGEYIFLLSRSVFPSVLTSDVRGVQLRHNAQIAFALAAHRADRGGYPSKLAELSPAYLKQVPQDLFAGRPLAYSASDNAYLLYSVGQNGKDEEGRGSGDTPPGDDLAVRMPRVE